MRATSRRGTTTPSGARQAEPAPDMGKLPGNSSAPCLLTWTWSSPVRVFEGTYLDYALKLDGQPCLCAARTRSYGDAAFLRARVVAARVAAGDRARTNQG